MYSCLENALRNTENCPALFGTKIVRDQRQWRLARRLFVLRLLFGSVNSQVLNQAGLPLHQISAGA